MLEQFSIVDGKFSTSQDGFPKISYYTQPDEAEYRYLIDVLKIDEHTLQSSLDPEESPRIEFSDDYTAIILKCPKVVSGEMEGIFKVGTFGGFFFHSGKIVSCSTEKSPSRRFPGSRDEVRSEKLKTQQDIMLRWLSQAIRMFEIQLRLINTRREKLKKEMTHSPENKKLMNMSDLRESLIYYIDALQGNGHLIERLRTAGDRIGFSRGNMEFLEDLAIENQQFLEQARVGSQVLTELMDSWNSIINNNLSIVMKNMNSLVIAISIPSFFTGLGGMSEFTAFVSPCLEWYIAYPLFFVIMVIGSVLIYNIVQHFYRT